jgi:hypothetical protein
MLGVMSPLSLRFPSMLRNWIPTRFPVCKLRQGVKWFIANKRNLIPGHGIYSFVLRHCSTKDIRFTQFIVQLLMRDIFISPNSAEETQPYSSKVLPVHTASVLIRGMVSLVTHESFSIFWHGIVRYTRGASCLGPSAPLLCGIHEIVELHVSYASTCKQRSAYLT